MFVRSAIARDRGVTTIPAALRKRAAVEPNTELVFVEVDSGLWLVGPKDRHPEAAAPAVAAALQATPFPKLMRRIRTEPAPPRDESSRLYRPSPTPELTEEQMIALGARAVTPSRHHRGRR